MLHYFVFRTHYGQICKFPFEFEGRTYYHCGSASLRRDWCYVKTPNINCGNVADPPWDYCLTDYYKITEYRSCYKDGEEPCMFPFEYEGITYTGCAQRQDGSTFCLTKRNTKKACDRMIYHEEKTENNKKCIFPMEYHGIKYNECVYDYSVHI